jgi:hypothetical protein
VRFKGHFPQLGVRAVGPLVHGWTGRPAAIALAVLLAVLHNAE